MLKKYLLIGALCSLLALTGCGGGDEQVATPEGNESEQATQDNDVSLAQELADQNTIEDVSRSGSVEDCNTLESKTKKQDCIDIVTFNQVKNGTTESCGKIANKDLKEQCKSVLAELKAELADGQSVLKALDNEDPSVCAGIEDKTSQTDCYLSLAVSTEESSYCEKIPDAGLIDTCRERVAEKAAE